MNLIRGISKDRLKFSLVKGMVEFSKTSNISIIAEGIETFDELDTIINLGVQYGQGYYFQKPERRSKRHQPSCFKVYHRNKFKKNHISIGVTSNIYIKNLSKTGHVVQPNDKVCAVYEDIIKNEDCQGLCVVENEEPVGIVTKEKIALKLSGNYGYSLYNNKCISGIMDKEFLKVEYDIPINIVTNLAMERSNDKLYDLIVVTENNKYIGTVTIKDCFKRQQN